MSDEAGDTPAEGEPVARPVVRRSMMFTTRAVPMASGSAETPAEAGREVQSRGVAELNIGAGEALLDDGLDHSPDDGPDQCPAGEDTCDIGDADEADLSREYEYEYLQGLANEEAGGTPGATTGPGRKKGTASGAGGDAQDSGDGDSDSGDGS